VDCMISSAVTTTVVYKEWTHACMAYLNANVPV